MTDPEDEAEEVRWSTHPGEESAYSAESQRLQIQGPPSRREPRPWESFAEVARIRSRLWQLEHRLTDVAAPRQSFRTEAES